jgi:phytoene desaturase
VVKTSCVGGTRGVARGVVVGGGISGLVSAAILASRGHDIVLLEKQPMLGGKIQEVTIDGFQFDFEPSMITMPWIFERVFREAGKTIDPQLRFIPLTVNSRNFFESGTIIDLTSDPDYMMQQLRQFSMEERQGFIDYLTESARLYEIADENFFENSASDWPEFLSLSWLKTFLSVYPHLTMDAFHKRFFTDPRLLAMMNRYATYVGSSPYAAPAALGFFAYLELVQGGYYVEGGNYRLIEALERLATEAEVHIFRQTPAEQIIVKANNRFEVKTEKYLWDADFVISSVDIATFRDLMQREPKQKKNKHHLQYSASSFLCLLGVEKTYKHLHHHNYFYPLDYSREYVDIFEQGEWSLSPTLHVSYSGFSEPIRCPEQMSNLVVHVHVPAYNPNHRLHQNEYYAAYRDFIIHWLETKLGLVDLSQSIVTEKIYGPKELEALTGTRHLAIDRVNASSFFQPNIKDKRVEGLYYTDSSTHIGGGIAMSVLNALHTVQLVETDLEKKEKTWTGVLLDY